jgi:predicted nicotinamide N-methyase
VGGTLWDSSLVLSKYLARLYHPNGLAGRRIIELGSGCGLVGIAAGRRLVHHLHTTCLMCLSHTSSLLSSLLLITC